MDTKDKQEKKNIVLEVQNVRHVLKVNTVGKDDNKKEK